MRRTSVKLLAVLALAITVTATGTAAADPAVTPPATDIVGVGTEDTEGVLNGLSAGYSWDATGPSPIAPKAGAAPIGRPSSVDSGLSVSVNGWICKNATSTIRSYGFLPLPAIACGSTI
ncbi:hypothetical protein [Kitasatospora sp. NPDC088548]|uniref:hypothetical protein n=1 Tax=Kitasatospora sp. NPDC088548 TaxID=3364075 RepID=UPI00381E1A8A